jgi:hypothetical protein
MPKGQVSRYKKVHCRTCNKLIKVFDRSKYAGYHVPQEDILDAIRHHYKKSHPRKFQEMYGK